MVLAKREDTCAAKGSTKVPSIALSIAVQPLSTSNVLQIITPPSTEIAAQAVIGQDIFILFSNNKAQEAC